MAKKLSTSRKETEFALSALMEIPSQYKETIELNILGSRQGNAPHKVPLPPPVVYGAASFSSSNPSHSTSFKPSSPPYNTYSSPVGSAPPVTSSTFENLADLDNSGTVDYSEFVAAMLNLNKTQKEDHMFAGFSYFDNDGSGYITADELQQACEQFGLGDVHLDEIMCEVDQDNDGSIDCGEFVAMMQDTGFGKKGFQNTTNIGSRNAF